jgi:Asp-tRNA(Asn)/Glu-tRNA(Gln) amidotransferase A subunit family amidase
MEMTLESETGWLAAWQLRELLGRKELSAAEVMAACLARIEALDPGLRAFISVAGERATEQARLADAIAASGAPLGPLHGIPVAVKDDVWTEGIASSCGSLLYGNFIPDDDGEVIRRLRHAGALIVGKTNMPEFAAFSRSKNRLVSESLNPYDPGRTSGASSGGSAAALAAGLVPLAVGSDGGGSIRIPASLCGVIGLFPTVGRVPDDGTFSYSPYASLGPMARNVRDVASLFGVLVGQTAELSGDDVAPSPGLRIGFTADFGFIPVSTGIAELVADALGLLSEVGHLVEEVDLPLEPVWETFFALRYGYSRYRQDHRPLPFTATPEFDAFCRQPENFERLCPYTQRAMSQPPPTADDYADALVRQERLQHQFSQAFRRFDVIVSPTMHVVAPQLDDGWESPYDDPWRGTPYTAAMNLLHLPAVSYPVGMVGRLPVGLQIIGRGGDETTVMQVCRDLERVHPWTSRPDLAGLT